MTVYGRRVFSLVWLLFIRALFGLFPAEMEFIDKPIEEVLLFLADGAGLRVVPDETVTGRISFYVPGGDAVSVFHYFLDRHSLYLGDDGGIPSVSRVSLQETDSGRLILKAGGVSLEALIGRLARQCSVSILHDPFPPYEFEIHTVKENLGELLEVLISPLAGWRVIREGEFYYLSETAVSSGPEVPKELVRRIEPYCLENITSTDLQKRLPPAVLPENLILSADPYRITYNGTPEEQVLFRSLLDQLDLPLPQLRYDLLIVNQIRGNELCWDPEISVSSLPEFGQSALLGGIGSALSLNFDLVASFGYQFVLGMELALKESKARILADTTLCGLSGETVRFINSRTSRFRPEENTASEGHEFNTGTSIEITGRLDGGGMILLDVSVSQSTREPAGGEDGELPSSQEKGLKTRIRTLPGEPVVIGGFRQEDKRLISGGIPLLSRIPVLGLLFKRLKKADEETEMTLYIVPRVEKWPPVEDRVLLSRYFRKYGYLFPEGGE